MGETPTSHLDTATEHFWFTNLLEPLLELSGNPTVSTHVVKLPMTSRDPSAVTPQPYSVAYVNGHTCFSSTISIHSTIKVRCH